MSITDTLFDITYFKSHTATFKVPSRVSLLELQEIIEAEVAEKKELLPWIKLAKFGDKKTDKGSLRHDANVITITGCECDYDGGKMTVAEAVAKLAGANIACVIHTSPSHSEDAPRWRVLAPTSKETAKEDRYKLVARINGVLGGVIAAESFTLSQSYYYGHIDGRDAQVELVEGRYIDQCGDLDAIAIGKPGTKSDDGNGSDRPHADIEELVKLVLSGASLHPSVASIAGVYAARGSPRQDCLDLVGAAFDAAKQARYGGRWDECVEVIDWVYAKEAKKNAPPPGATPLPWFDLALDGVDVPEHEWAVPDRIPLHQVCLFSGHGGTGKSLISLHLAVAHALGREWLGSLPAMGGTFFLDAEEDATEIHIRLEAIRKFYDCRYSDFLSSGLNVLPLAGKDCLMATVPPRTGIVTPTAFYERFLQQAGDLKPVNIIIANASNVFAGNENDRSAVQQFMGLMKRITNVTGGSVTLISHSSLTGLAREDGLSGTTQWHNAVRARMWLRVPKVEGNGNGNGAAGGEGKQPDSDLRQLDFVKNQYGKLSASMTLRWKNGMLLPLPAETDFEKAARTDTAERVFLEWARKLQGRGQNMSPSKTARNYAPHLIATELPADSKVTKSDLIDAMNRLLENNRVVTLTTSRGTYLRIP